MHANASVFALVNIDSIKNLYGAWLPLLGGEGWGEGEMLRDIETSKTYPHPNPSPSGEGLKREMHSIKIGKR
jgi:hypothetical protein